MKFRLLFSITISRLCLTVAFGNQAQSIALCIDARLFGNVSLCASRTNRY